MIITVLLRDDHLYVIDSQATGNQFYKVHLTGVHSHGTDETFLFFDQHEWASDSDSANTILLQSLLKLSKVILHQVLFCHQ